MVGYINVYLNAEEGAFAHQGCAELVDLGVLKKYRRNGMGGKLMDVAEQIADKNSRQTVLELVYIVDMEVPGECM